MNQLYPPTNDQVFEWLICDLFNAMEKTNSYQIFGRKGQSQNEIDILSNKKQTVIQCKKKDIANLTNKGLADIKKNLIDVFAKSLEGAQRSGVKFERFILASTYKDDKDLQKLASTLTSKKINVEYWGWDHISKFILKYPHILNEYSYSFKEQQINRKSLLNKQAFYGAEFVYNHLFKAHRGAILWQPNLTLVFGNDGYSPSKGEKYTEGNLRTLNEVIIFRKKIKKLKIEELAFSFGEDGYTWGMLLKTKKAEKFFDLIWTCYDGDPSYLYYQKDIAYVALNSYWNSPHTYESQIKY